MAKAKPQKGNVKDKSAYKVKDMSSGMDLKSGFKATKPMIDGFKGKPAQVNKKNEYISDSSEALSDLKQKGYKTKIEE